MKYTQQEVLNDFRKFKVFKEAVERLENAIGLLGSPRHYSRHIDYIYDILNESCTEMSKEFIVDVCEAIDKSNFNRLHYHYDNKIPFDKDFNTDLDDFNNVREMLKTKYNVI